MKTKLRYNHAVNFGNFDIDALEAYLPREIEIEQNEEFELLEVSLTMIELKTEDDYLSTLAFSIESQFIIVKLIHTPIDDKEELVKEILEYNSETVKTKITRVLNEQFSNMVDAIKGNQENEIEKQKTEEFIRKHF